jgi:non-homologous end joining protein Ku
MATTVQNTMIRWGMLNIPAALRAGKASSDVKLDRAWLDDSGEYRRVRRIDVAPEDGHEDDEDLDHNDIECVVPAERIVHGRWNDDGTFTEVGEEALKTIKAATVIDGIEIVESMPLSEVPLERATASYFLAAPAGTNADRSLALLRTVLQGTNYALVGKMTIRSRQKLVVIYAKGGALLALTLAFAEDCAPMQEAALPAQAEPLNQQAFEMAVKLVYASERGEMPFVDTAGDEAAAQRKVLMEDALAGKTLPTPAPQKLPVEVDFEEMLRRSVAEAVAAH